MQNCCNCKAKESRLVQTHPRLDPPEGLDQNRFETGRPEYSGGRWPVFSPQKSTPTGQFRFLSLKTRKTWTDRRKTQILMKKNPDLTQKTQIQAIFQVDQARFWHDLVKSHQIQWDYHRIWRNLIDSDEIFTGSRVFLPFSRVFSETRRRPTCPPPVEVWPRSTRLLRRSTTSEIFQNPIPSGRFRVGHKPNPNQPVDSPKRKHNCRYYQGELTIIEFLLIPFFQGKMKLWIIFIELMNELHIWIIMDFYLFIFIIGFLLNNCFHLLFGLVLFLFGLFLLLFRLIFIDVI